MNQQDEEILKENPKMSTSLEYQELEINEAIRAAEEAKKQLFLKFYNMIDSTKEFYTPTEVRKLLQIGRSKMESLYNENLLDRINISPSGKRPTYRITKDSLKKFIKTHL